MVYNVDVLVSVGHSEFTNQPYACATHDIYLMLHIRENVMFISGNTRQMHAFAVGQRLQNRTVPEAQIVHERC